MYIYFSLVNSQDRKMRMAFTYNVKKSAPVTGQEEDMEFDSPEVIEEVRQAIYANGHEIRMIEADESAYEQLKKYRTEIDLVFNMAEGLRGQAREAQIPIYCELLKIPYTHSGPVTMAVCLHKQMCKQVLKAGGIRVPGNKKFPMIVKPNLEGSSRGIFDWSVVTSDQELKKAVKKLENIGIKDILSEEFIDGREFTVALIGNEPEVLPIFEQKFEILPAEMHKIAGFEYKWIYETQMKDVTDGYSCPAELSEKESKLIELTSKKIFKFLEVRDACRIDYRMDNQGKLYFIEINTIPGIIKDPVAPSYFVYSAYKAGMSYEQMIGKIIDSAVERWNQEVR